MDITFTLNSSIFPSEGTIKYDGVQYQKTGSFSYSPAATGGYIDIPTSTTSIDFTVNPASGGTNPTLKAFYDETGTLAPTEANSGTGNTMNVSLSNVTQGNTESFALLIQDEGGANWALDPQLKINNPS